MRVPRKTLMATLVASTVLAGQMAYAASCATVADNKGLNTVYPQQLELSSFEQQTGAELTFKENPMFAAEVKAGKLPPVAERLPEEPLVILPYEECGQYGGTMKGMSIAYESGTSEILAWRQVQLVRMSDDLQTIKPMIAKSWQWNEDFTQITFKLRKGLKWSDGDDFTAEDVAFWMNDIVNNKQLHKNTPNPWNVGVKAKVINDTTVRFDFDKPYPAMLTYLTGFGSYYTAFAPAHFFKAMHPKYNKNADKAAKAAGYDDWIARFDAYWDKWMDSPMASPIGVELPTMEAHIMDAAPTTERRTFRANPYYFAVDSSGQQLPYVDKVLERFIDKKLFPLEIINGNVDQKSQSMDLAAYPTLKENEKKGNYEVRLPPGDFGPAIIFNQTHKDPVLQSIYSDLRFRKAMSLAMDRDEINELLYLGLGQPWQASPVGVEWQEAWYDDYYTDFDTDQANALLDEMGLKMGPDGVRLRPDGKPLRILWEYTLQYTKNEKFPVMVADMWKEVGVDVILKEITTQLLREKSAANDLDINMDWATGGEVFRPSIASNFSYWMPPYSDFSPQTGVPWRDWLMTDGKEGSEPPAWAKRQWEIGKQMPTLMPGSDQWIKLGKEGTELFVKNLVVIGTVGGVPLPNTVHNRMGNVPNWKVNTWAFGYSHPSRPDQWFIKQQ